MQDKLLTFREWKDNSGKTFEQIAVETGLSYFQVYNLYYGRRCSLKKAVIIEDYTKGEVKCRAMLPDKQVKEVEEKKQGKQSEKR